MDKKKRIKTIINTLGRILMVLSLIFVVRAIYRLGFDVSKISDPVSFILLAVTGAVVFAGGVYLQGLAWKSWLEFFTGKKADPAEALGVYAKANIGKYLPGNVMHYVERNLFASKSGASQTALALSSVFEIGTQVAVALLLAVICRGGTIVTILDAARPGWRKAALILAAAGILVLAAGIVIAVKRFGDRLKELTKGYSIAGFFVTLVKTMLLYVSVMLIGGLIMSVLFGYMGTPIDASMVFMIVPGYVIAWVLGFVVPGAPGGIGVREFVLTMLLGPVIGGGLVVTVMVIHRFINIIGDFLAYLFQMLFLHRGER